MADTDTAPLTDDERAELEALRAEKARREEGERARAERAELEALRAEQRAAEEAEARAQAAAEQVAQPAAAPAAQPVAPKPKPKSAAPAPEDEAPAEKSFGVRMVTSDTVDKDGIPTMPMAQKIIMVVCALLVIGYIYFYIL